MFAGEKKRNEKWKELIKDNTVLFVHNKIIFSSEQIVKIALSLNVNFKANLHSRISTK